MALATTCPQCKTSFKVIPDQLKLRRGLVRCGVCQHVFSGIDYLRYVDESGKSKPVSATDPTAPATSRERPATAAKAVTDRDNTRMASPAADAPASPQTVIAGDDELKTAFFLSDSTFGPFTQARPVDAPAPAPIGSPVLPPVSTDFARDFVNDGTTRIGPGGAAASRPRNERAGAGSRPAPVATPSPSPATPSSGAAASSTTAASVRTTPESVPRESARESTRETARTTVRNPPPIDDLDPRPSARRSARRSLLDDDDVEVAAANALARQARDALRGGRQGSRSGRRRSHGSGSAVDFRDLGDYFSDTRRTGLVIGLSVLLLLQLLLAFRSEIVSRLPSTRPALEVAAGIFGMNLDTVRSLSSLTIESFELQNTERADQIALNAVLRNRDGHAVRWPAMVLTLSDPAGAIVVRKVILPSDYLNRTAPREGLGGRSEWPVRLLLETGAMQLAGYSVALVYP